MWSLEKPEVIDTACFLSGHPGKSHAVSQDRLLLLFAHYFKASLSQKKCEARRIIWMRYEGKILGILFSLPRFTSGWLLCPVGELRLPVSSTKYQGISFIL